MIIFLYGKDSYRLKEEVHRIEEGFKRKGLSIEKTSAKDLSFREFWSIFFQFSIFEGQKVVFLRDVFSQKEFKKEFLESLAALREAKHTLVVYETEEIKNSEKLFQALKNSAQTKEFHSLEGFLLQKWIKKEFQKYGFKIEQEALDKLSEYVGNDLWQMKNEIEKLVNLKLSEAKKTITPQDVDLFVSAKIEPGIFEVIDALSKRDKKLALKLIQKYLDKGENPFRLLKTISSQVRNLLTARVLREKRKTLRDLLVLELSHPYAAQKAWQASAYFTLSQLKKICQCLFEVDLKAKTTDADLRDLLLELVVEF